MICTKTKLALLFGGISNEYAISLCSAAAILRALDRTRYEVHTIGIDRGGRWLLTEATPDEIEKDEWQAGGIPCLLSPNRDMRGLLICRAHGRERLVPDVILPVLHGKGGEDGSLQGLLSLSGIPFVGCGVQASAVCMDKVMSKRLARDAGIPVVPWVSLSGELLRDEERARAAAEERLCYPMFIKPSRSGSSVGAAMVACPREFGAALREAAAEDDLVLAERFIPAREIEVAVLGDEVAYPGEILPPGDGFYSYAAKYETSEATLHLRAALSPTVAEQVRAYAAQLYRLFGCRGGVRIDFFLSREDGRLYFNEVNTMPGFTAISMFPRLMTQTRSMTALLDEMIARAGC